MNEELKPSALSSGLVQRNDKQGDHPEVRDRADLNDFLIRRQLLAMEGKRIQELLREAEAELKARQDRLVGVRDRVLAALRNHLELHEELARIKILGRGQLQNLPRTVERYIRRRVKKIFASRKPPASTTMTDRPVRLAAKTRLAPAESPAT